ncbi:MAG: ribonuclease T [Bryobacteraceae bacterium]
MFARSRRLTAALILMASAAWLATDLEAQRRRAPVRHQAEFSYYLLSLSYAPDFCDQPNGDKDPRECGAGRKIGFVVHGLWPQSDSGRGPERCGPARPVGRDIVQDTLRYVPTESLIQHEWTNHGTCSGLAAGEYFAQLRSARNSVKIPDDLAAPTRELHLTPREVEAKFAAANPRFPRGAFRATCYRDGVTCLDCFSQS